MSEYTRKQDDSNINPEDRNLDAEGAMNEKANMNELDGLYTNDVYEIKLESDVDESVIKDSRQEKTESCSKTQRDTGGEEENCCCNESDNTVDSNSEERKEDVSKVEFERIKKELENKTKESEKFLDMARRTAAEFDNFKKRTIREKQAIYDDTIGEVVKEFLPVLDNLERAVNAENTNDIESFREGVRMVLRQMNDVLKKLGVEEIASVGEQFDPNFHNAVMHIESDECAQNVILEEFQKGYKIKDKVIRYSMVKVAN